MFEDIFSKLHSDVETKSICLIGIQQLILKKGQTMNLCGELTSTLFASKVYTFLFVFR